MIVGTKLFLDLNTVRVDTAWCVLQTVPSYVFSTLRQQFWLVGVHVHGVNIVKYILQLLAVTVQRKSAVITLRVGVRE